MPKMLTSLRSRLIASYIFIIIICLALVSLASILLLSRFQARLVISRLFDAAVPTALRVYTFLERGLSPAEIADLLKEQAERQEVRILLLTAGGRVLADTQGNWTGKQAKVDLTEIPKDARTPYISGRITPPNGDTQLYVALSATPPRLATEDSESRQPVFVALLASPRRGFQTVLKDIVSHFFQAGLVALAISIILALLIARSIAKPLQRITAATEEIARGNYDQTLGITSTDEVGRLATSFNTMAREVKASRQAQRDFVANVSHELKTPLTSIQGFSQAILDGTAEDEINRHRAVQIISSEANRMSRLVDELLDLARIESGQIKMMREPVDLVQVLETCIEKFALRARENNVTLTLDVPILPPVTGDKDRLAQVFTNLLENALKHTPPTGKVTVKAREINTGTIKKTTLVPAVEITVTDTGVGIPPQDLEHIFERFYQVDKSRSGKNRGTGLGLTIAQQIAEAHRGTISVESVRELGTKFTVVLPTGRSSY
jgi:two-component system OmpR family sensor kinase